MNCSPLAIKCSRSLSIRAVLWNNSRPKQSIISSNENIRQFFLSALIGRESCFEFLFYNSRTRLSCSVNTN